MMNLKSAASLGLSLVLAGCGGASVGGADYSPAYDFHEFYAVADGKPFRVVVAGNPFPALTAEESRRRLLPVMQANRPRPRLTFTYDLPADRPRPDYRMVLVFDAASDLTAARVCADQVRLSSEPRRRDFEVFAVYCRNEDALSQTTARTPAESPEDPRVGALLRSLFLVLFSEVSPARERRFPFFGPR
jgi:hypothetical protein